MRRNRFRLTTLYRAAILFLVHVSVFCGVYVLATMLRFDWDVPAAHWALCWQSMPWYVAVKLWFFYCIGSFQGWWRYVTFTDLVDLMKAVIVSTLCIVAIDYFVVEDYQVPRAIVLMDFVLTILCFGAMRSSIRLFRECLSPAVTSGSTRRTLIVGASVQSEAIARQINGAAQSGYRAVGFLDSETRNHGSWLGGIPVLGSPVDVAKLASRSNVKDILVVGDSLSGTELRKTMQECRNAGLAMKIVPRVEDIISGRYRFRVRKVAINDLLRREPVELDTTMIAELLQGRRVLVTGAGGSIGSEICRQLVAFQPESLVLVERFESALFYIHRELGLTTPATVCHPCVGDILDADRMEAIFERYRPDVVFHAAAHKHVPLMERNPAEAIKNNVFGTKSVADLSRRYGVEHFVLISTDKAVNPTSVMGVSKQLAEQYVSSLVGKSDTRFLTVRFGNVLGSNGSVVPIFREQIRQGGPVTVTHPDMCRYFMTIPEAAQLVLQAAAIGKGGEIFVLDMGQPVRILDLARDMIRLSGLSLEDIPIDYTGIRPGEKLYEELQSDNERLLPTVHPKVSAAYPRPYANDTLDCIAELRSVIGSRGPLLAKLRELVAEYQPVEAPEDSDASVLVGESMSGGKAGPWESRSTTPK